MKKKILLGVLIVLFSVFVCACGGDFENKSDENITVTQEISEEVRIVQRKIDKALESEPTYEDWTEIRELYEDLLNAEQEQVINYDKVEELFSLSEDTVACIYAANKLKDQLKNPSTLNIISASCTKNTTYGTISVKIDYAADNNVGGTIEDEYYCIVDIPIEDENGNWSCKLDDYFESSYNLERISGRISSQDTARQSYNRKSTDAIEVNAAQIMDNLDLPITDLPSKVD